jgi:hypothetical protein
MNARGYLTVAVLFAASIALATAEVTTQPNPPSGRNGGFHQKRPWSVGSGMEGSITNIIETDQRIQFTLTGWFWLTQYPEGGTNKQTIMIDCRHGVEASVNNGDRFVAMTRDGRAGAVRNGKGTLLKLLQTAAQRGASVKFELMRPKIDFGENSFTLKGADVWKVTDIDLQ